MPISRQMDKKGVVHIHNGVLLSHEKEDIQMANKHMRRYSTSLLIRETQIKTTMRYHLMLVRMAIIKKPTNNNAGEGVKKREPSFGGNANWYSTMENSVEIP